jgi:hypothetical protein
VRSHFAALGLGVRTTHFVNLQGSNRTNDGHTIATGYWTTPKKSIRVSDSRAARRQEPQGTGAGPTTRAEPRRS